LAATVNARDQTKKKKKKRGVLFAEEGAGYQGWGYKGEETNTRVKKKRTTLKTKNECVGGRVYGPFGKKMGRRNSRIQKGGDLRKGVKTEEKGASEWENIRIGGHANRGGEKGSG